MVQREALRVSRTSVREAHTTFRRAVSDWQEASKCGRRAMEAFSNAILRMWYLPHLSLGPLVALPDLRPAATAKLLSLIHKHLNELAEAINSLRTFQQAMADAQIGVNESCAMEGAPAAVFQSMSGSTISSLLQSISSMHGSQLEVRRLEC